MKTKSSNTTVSLLKADQSAKEEILAIEKNVLSRLTSSNLISIPEIIDYYFSHGGTFLIQVGKQTVGVVAVREKKDEIELTSILIKKKYQGLKIGTKVLEEILNKFGTHKKWTVITHPENHHSIRFYWKFGFEFSDWLGDYFGTGEPRIRMTRKISAKESL
jgi:ribosomal protein S18 acetylase RimI-like enzyme